MRISVKVTHLAHDRLILVQILLFAYINKEKLFFLFVPYPSAGMVDSGEEKKMSGLGNQQDLV
jgi:hypothetical protein